MSPQMLLKLKPGQKGRILKILGTGAIRRRILDMGLVNGAEVEVERVAPRGDPLEVKITGYHISLRKDEAANIFVEAE
ncbi:MAG: ferrous iron transport protein A [Kiritimatiellia bacterium]|nr:ferrous iron transport protein A [Kiritimatiellia bacterium]